MNKLIITIILFVHAGLVNAQSVNDFMEKVSLNNPDLKAASQLMSADEAMAKTGINPDDPVVRGGYFPGSPSTSNDKFTWGISQSFDFPSRYSRLKELKRTNLELARNEYALIGMELMEGARSMAIEYIGNVERLSKLEERNQSLLHMEEGYNKMLESGETTIIEYNKIRMWRTRIESEFRALKNETAILASRLDYMSGNNSGLLEKSAFPVFYTFDIDSLLNTFKNAHPAFLRPIKENGASLAMVNLVRSENLPSFELGYSSEIVGTERFTGPSLGISLPIWKNRGKVKSTIARSAYIQQNTENKLLLLETEYRNYYATLQIVRNSIKLVKETLENSNNRDMLNKMLDEGEITLSDYYLELSAIYELEDLYIDLRVQKNTLLSKLFENDFNN